MVEARDGLTRRPGKLSVGWLALAGTAAVCIFAIGVSSRDNGAAKNRDRLHQVQLRQAVSFDLSGASIPVGEIQSGGPPKDGIPAISGPRIVSADKANSLEGKDRVIGVVIEGHARAYPIGILNYHEIVNDTLEGATIAVTYCPLCDSAVVFDRKTPLGEREFGVSGLLYNSNVLMYDRANKESLWSQMNGQGVSGPAVGKTLDVLPMELTTWTAWTSRHPKTDVMSSATGFTMDYRKSPYVGYFRQRQLMFPAKPINPVLALKESVLGVWDGQGAVAFTKFSFGPRKKQIERTINGKQITVAYDRANKTIRVVSADQELNWLNSFWFAWYAFRPQTQIATP